MVAHHLSYISMAVPDSVHKVLCCKHCGCAMEWYGNWKGIVGWHLTWRAIDTDTGDVCSECRRKELKGEL